jgi:hypothetical protein
MFRTIRRLLVLLIMLFGASLILAAYTARGHWTDATTFRRAGRIDTIYLPALAADGLENAVLVWAESVGHFGGTQVWAIAYERGAGWGHPEPLGDRHSIDPAVAMVGGAATAVWEQGGLRGARYNVVQGGWDAPTQVDSNPSDFIPAVAMDDSGALALWPAVTGEKGASRYADGKWSAPETTPPATDSSYSAVVSFDSRSGIAGWQDWSSHFWMMKYELGKGWGAPLLVQDNIVTRVLSPPGFVANRFGEAFATWSDYIQRQDVRGVRYVGKGPWSTTIYLPGSPAIALDASGNALVVWEQPDGVWSRRFE